MKLTGNVMTVYINGTSQGTLTANATMQGADANSRPWQIGGSSYVDIGELLVYDSALSDTNRQNIEAYLQGKYGIGAGFVTLTRDTSTTYGSSAAVFEVGNQGS